MTLMIDFPFAGAGPWVDHFKEVELPVLRHTVHQLEELRSEAETINVRKLAAIITHDPLMTLRVYRYMQEKRSKSRTPKSPPVERALVMMGTYSSSKTPRSAGHREPAQGPPQGHARAAEGDRPLAPRCRLGT